MRLARPADRSDLAFLLQARRATYYGADAFDPAQEKLQTQIALARGDRWFVLERGGEVPPVDGEEQEGTDGQPQPPVYGTAVASAWWLPPASRESRKRGVPRMALLVEPYGPLLAVETLYRQGPAPGLRADLRALASCVVGCYAHRARWVYLTVHVGNPRFPALLRIYQRMFGFEVEALRLRASLSKLDSRLLSQKERSEDEP